MAELSPRRWRVDSFHRAHRRPVTPGQVAFSVTVLCSSQPVEQLFAEQILQLQGCAQPGRIDVFSCCLSLLL